jgi:hypothetical protein
MERVSLLELTVWRASCLNGGGIKFDSMQEIEDLQAKDETLIQLSTRESVESKAE